MNFDTSTRERFPYSFFSFNPSFFDDLVAKLDGLRVLEVFAGNGRLASMLQERGIYVTPTSLHSGHDGHTITGFFTPVEHLNAVHAAKKYRDTHDIMLMSWPTVTDDALLALQIFNKPIVFIGEMSDAKNLIYGGCATDEFFENIDIIHEFSHYQGNYLERAFIAELKKP